MITLSRACAGLVVALLLAPGGQGFAQTPPQSPPPQSPPAQPPTQSPPAQGETQREGAAQPQGQPQDARRRAERPSKRTPRARSAPARQSLRQPREPRDRGPSTRQLMLTGNVGGGYDDNLIAGTGAGAGTSPNAMASGPTQSVDATLGYFHGNASRSIRVETTGTLRSYPDYLQRPAVGGVASISARTPLPGSLALAVSERAGYEPFLNVVSPGVTGPPLPAGITAVAPATGLFERRSVNSVTSFSLERAWSARDSTSLVYSYGLQQFTDAGPGDSNAHDIRAEYRRRVTG